MRVCFFLAKVKQPKTKRVKHYYVGEDWVFGDIMMMNRVQLFAFQSKCFILPRDEKCLFFTAHRHPVEYKGQTGQIVVFSKS